jgi:hypothetical protein
MPEDDAMERPAFHRDNLGTPRTTANVSSPPSLPATLMPMVPIPCIPL